MTARPTPRRRELAGGPRRPGPGCAPPPRGELRPERGGAHGRRWRPGPRSSSTLDGDGQNDPAFIPRLVAALEGGPQRGLAAGQRVGRKDEPVQEPAVARSPTACAAAS